MKCVSKFLRKPGPSRGVKKCGGRWARKCNELCAAQAVTSVVCTNYQREMAVLVLGNSSLTSSVTGRCCSVCGL